MTLSETMHEVRRARLTLPWAGTVTLAALGVATLVRVAATPLAGVDLVVGKGAGRQTVGAATAGAWLALTCLHVSVGMVVILGLARETHPRTTGAVA